MNDQIKNARDRIIIALDFPQPAPALALVEKLSGDAAIFKIGLQLYIAAGPEIVRAVAATGAQIFLDLKLHDIPNTVAKAVGSAGELGVRMLTVHLSGGQRMLEAAAKECPPNLLLLGVTVLTSSNQQTLTETGVVRSIEEQTIRLAKLGAESGLRGLIASPQEARALRAHLGDAVTIITPGVRPAWSAADDQKRFTTPREAIDHGADYLVIGRPITADPDPAAALQRILGELV